MDATLKAKFEALAVKTRTRSNSISAKLTSLLHEAREKKLDAIEVKAGSFGVEKVHIATLYNALAKLGIEKKRGESFVVENTDAYYWKSAIVKLA